MPRTLKEGTAEPAAFLDIRVAGGAGRLGEYLVAGGGGGSGIRRLGDACLGLSACRGRGAAAFHQSRPDDDACGYKSGGHDHADHRS